MLSSLLSNSCRLSQDATLFPLLASQPVSFRGKTYPTRILFSDGTEQPLFSGGMVGSHRIEEIAAGMAAAIAREHHGRKILLIETLEGARFFFRKIVDNLRRQQGGGGWFDCASLQVRSYANGSQAAAHKVLLPLQNEQGDRLQTLAAYDAVLVVDDLIDEGNTFAWLVERYLPDFQAGNIAGYFMLNKAAQVRGLPVQRVLERTPILCGVAVSNEWVVGCGLDLALPEAKNGSALSIFRQELPGGIYAFNHAIEKQLIAEYQRHPQNIRDQLQVYSDG